MERNYYKKYLMSVLILLLGCFLISLVIFYGVGKGFTNKTLLFSVIAALVPSGSYVGFVIFGERLIKKNKLSKGVMIAVCIFFPVTLAIITLSGIILIIPSIIYAVKKINEKET